MYDGALRYNLYYDGSSLYTGSLGRYCGRYVRCVSEEKDVSDLTYMQDMTAKVVASPKGWTLPSVDQISTLSGEGDGSDIYIPSFSPVLGGNYNNGTLNLESTRGYWWSSTATIGTERHLLAYDGSSLYTGGRYRYYGVYVRCIQAS